jgi:hypothetical protein
MLLYNHAVTGDWLKLPYFVYQHRYDPVPVFRFQHGTMATSPGHEVIRRFYEIMLPADLKRLKGFDPGAAPAFGISFAEAVRVRGKWLIGFVHLKPWLWIGFLFLLAAIDRWALLAAGIVAVMAATTGLTTWVEPHYAAPALPLLIALWAIAMRRAGAFRARRFPIGLVGACLALLAWAGNGIADYVRLDDPPNPHAGPPGVDWARSRGNLEDSLVHAGGKHLVIVAYTKSHSPHMEWVYNGADIDGSPVVFARDMGPTENARLIRYFHDREVLRVTVDRDVGPFVVERVAPATPPPLARGADRVSPAPGAPPRVQ